MPKVPFKFQLKNLTPSNPYFTEHLRYEFLVNGQRDAQIFFMYLFLFITLYMFRAPRAHHQERQIDDEHDMLVICREL